MKFPISIKRVKEGQPKMLYPPGTIVSMNGPLMVTLLFEKEEHARDYYDLMVALDGKLFQVNTEA